MSFIKLSRFYVIKKEPLIEKEDKGTVSIQSDSIESVWILVADWFYEFASYSGDI